MASAALGLQARVIDQGNGVYSIVDVERCDPSDAGELVDPCDFTEDIISCAMARLDLPGDSSRWVASMKFDGNEIVITAWLPPQYVFRQLPNSYYQSHSVCN